MTSEASAEQLDQTAPMFRFLLTHSLEHLRGGGVFCVKPIGKIGVNPLVFFLERNGQRENLALGQVLELPCQLRD